ncbi:hypothetical protein NUH86_01770 [Sphingobium sp. JS3065]|uniref:hypothetical protein n=1 Tax=Sphingobium sp. JS3065 TaxID=2970925 RepID=UPI002264FEBE|nr:hypothetical protein [Sphingobium sp. JS3065]UZW55559.1 hypothetical protein NUH86_01770 [Sphingobium sp. JS3065]
MAPPSRAVNLALRIVGITDAERDFKRVGDAGGKAFRDISQEALDAEKAVIRLTNAEKSAALVAERRRTARSEARALFPNGSDSPSSVRQQRRRYVADAVSKAEAAIDDAQGAQALENLATRSAAAEARLVALGRAAGLAGVAIVALGVATYKVADASDEHHKALEAFNRQIELTGNVSAATSEELEQFADKAARTSIATEKTALQAAATLAKVPGLARETLNEALSVAGDLGDDPEAITQWAEKMGSVLSALARDDIEALRTALADTNPELQITVMRLAEAGKTAEAQKAYIQGLARAASGSGGLDESAQSVGEAWDRMLTRIGDSSGVTSGLISLFDGIANAIDRTADRVANFGTRVANFYRWARGQQQEQEIRSPFATPIDNMLAMGRQAQGLATDAAARALMAKPDRPSRSGRGGKSDAEREAERRAREAEQARQAADRIKQSNDEVIASYKQRADEAQARLGLEGDALEAVVRQQTIDAAARRISMDLVEKEVTARKLAAKGQFDEAQARAEATAIVNQQTDAVRQYAAAEYDAAQAQKLFQERQRIANQLFDETRTPLERIAQEVANVQAAFDSGAISAFTFSRRMKQLAQDYVDTGRMGSRVWEGFGHDVGRTLSDIVLNGGTARDVLMELIRLPLERLLAQNVEAPIAKFVDGLTGNDVEKNVAKAKTDILPGLPQQLGIQAEPEFMRLTTAAGMAADALTRVAVAGGSPVVDPLADVGTEAAKAAEGMNAISGQSAQLGSAFNSLIAMAAGGSVSGGGGFLGTVLGLGAKLVAPAIGGGPVTSAGTDAVYGGTLGGIYHDGGTVRPGGKQRVMPFDMGALPRLHNGTLRNDEFAAVLQLDEEVLDRSQARAFRTLLRGGSPRRQESGGGGPTIVNNWNMPATPDRRRTGAEVARRQAEQQDDYRRRGLA